MCRTADNSVHAINFVVYIKYKQEMLVMDVSLKYLSLMAESSLQRTLSSSSLLELVSVHLQAPLSLD